MPWMQILLFLLKYGPQILGLVKSIWDLIVWIQGHEKQVMAVIGGDSKSIARQMHALAKDAKQRKDVSHLVELRIKLGERAMALA